MHIGICKENRSWEKRVILLPEDMAIISRSASVVIEEGAGEGIGISDEAYVRAGATTADTKTVYSSELVVRLKEPNEKELSLMRPGSAIFSMMHLAGNAVLRGWLKKYKLLAIAMDELTDALGRRMVEALHQTGYLGMQKGFALWGKDPSQCTVKIMGYGNVACGALQCAARKYARVTILHKQDFENMSEHIPGTDILVNAINWPQELRGKKFLIRRKMLRLFKKDAVLLDLISNPPGQSPIETMHPTTIDDISYVVDGVIHASCWGWPGLDPVNISRRYSKQVTPILKDIVDSGLENLPEYISEACHEYE